MDQFSEKRVELRNAQNEAFLTCPATANPSARRDVASQTCRQIWNAAIGIEPCLAAIDAASVTQKVTATTLASNRKPETKQGINDCILTDESVNLAAKQFRYIKIPVKMRTSKLIGTSFFALVIHIS